MKKLIFLVAVTLVALVSNGQNKAILKSGQQIEGKITAAGKMVVFDRTLKIDSVSTNNVDVMDIAIIRGVLSKKFAKEMLTFNSEILFDQMELNELAVHYLEKNAEQKSKQQEYLDNKSSKSMTVAPNTYAVPSVRYVRVQTAGDLIAKSAQLRLWGYVIGSAVPTASLLLIDDPDVALTVGFLGATAGVVMYIVGESLQIRAGRIMNQHLTITPASSGLGVAVNF